MNAVKTYSLLFMFFVIVFVFSYAESCKPKNNQLQHTDDINNAIREEIGKYAYPLPSVFEASEMLNGIEAAYLSEIVSRPEKAETYYTEKSKALNLGFYATDLVYAITYNRKPDMQNYLKASETLVRELDFAAAFDPDLPDRIEDNFENKDQLVQIITGMFQNVYAYLNRQGRSEVSYLVLCGTIVEGIYLTTHISANTFQNTKIIEAILFQKEPLEKLQKMMENQKSSELLKETYQDISRINEIYAQEPGNTSMTEKQVTGLTGLVAEIRNKYINRQ